MASLGTSESHWTQPTIRREDSASGQLWQCGRADVSVRQQALDPAARKDSGPLDFSNIHAFLTLNLQSRPEYSRNSDHC